jgi:hypothetical protein
MNEHEMKLTSAEIALLAALLEATSASLAVQIRHSSSNAYKQMLRERLHLVDGLLERMTVNVPAGA